VDDLEVDDKFLALVAEDEDADAAAAVVERVSDTGGQAGLVEDRKTLLDITSLGHGNDGTIFTNVEDTVLLEDRTKHVLDND